MPVQRKRSAATRSNGNRGRASRAAGRSTPDAIATLKQDHGTLKKLLKQLESADDSGKRSELLEKVEMEVKIHTTIEEEIFYPAFHDVARTEKDEKLFFEAHEEHHVVDLVMPEIKGVNVEDETFPAKAKVLKDLIEHHIEEEETQMFPKARKLLGASELKNVGEQLRTRKEELSAEYGVDTRRGRRRAA